MNHWRLRSSELEKKCADLTDVSCALRAELENFRRRTQRDADEQRRFESLRLLRDLLPGLDGLQRAIQSAEQTGDSAALLNGIRRWRLSFEISQNAFRRADRCGWETI